MGGSRSGCIHLSFWQTLMESGTHSWFPVSPFFMSCYKALRGIPDPRHISIVKGVTAIPHFPGLSSLLDLEYTDSVGVFGTLRP